MNEGTLIDLVCMGFVVVVLVVVVVVAVLKGDS